MSLDKYHTSLKQHFTAQTPDRQCCTEVNVRKQKGELIKWRKIHMLEVVDLKIYRPSTNRDLEVNNLSINLTPLDFMALVDLCSQHHLMENCFIFIVVRD